jgi:uncharacterized membrane protein YfcA
MLLKIIFLCTAGFFASLVDSIAGGGGIISVPAFLIAGIPPHIALGTNKFSSSCGSFTSSLKFTQSNKVDFKLLKFLIPFSLVGALLGVSAVLIISTGYLTNIVLVLLLSIGVFSLFSKAVGLEDKFKGFNRKNIALGILLALVMGFYDGFFGPGAGSILIFGMIGIFGFDFVRAGGNAKVLNFVSNITSLVIFAFHFQINYIYGIPVAIAMILGARVGVRLAINKGAKLIKPIFVAMSLAAAIKMLYQVILS